MLRIIQSASSAAAKNYYSEGLSKEDYYTQGQEMIGRWGGKAAEKMGLEGKVDKLSFDRLCDNLHPLTGDRLTARTKANRKVGYDINFHAPKSVSLVQALSGDGRIVDAFRDAVRETMTEMESEVQTLVRQKGSTGKRTAGNWAYGEFIHFTARPVKGLCDPHLHAHCFTFNAVWDAVETRWKAGEFVNIKRDAPYFEAAFHARLAGKLADLGFSIKQGAKGWEISGIERATIEKFSLRTELIEKLAREKGIITDKLKDTLGAKTRESKRKGLTENNLAENWLSRLSPDEVRGLVGISRAADGFSTKKSISNGQAVEYALAHGFARASVLTEKELLAVALRFGVGSVTVEGVKKELETRIKAGDVIAKGEIGKREMTTRAVLMEEKAMIDFAKGGRSKCAALGASRHEFRRDFLTSEQKAAVKHILHSNDRVIALRGGAGTGKTTLMQEAVEGIKEGGKQVFTFAPSANASRGVLRKEGFKEADTVARLLENKELHEKIRGNVIWIDEAGLVSSPTMRQVFDLAHKLDARVILSGDVRQHASPARGDALRILEDNGAVKQVELTHIQRQKGSYKRAVESIAKGDIEKGFDQLDKMGAIVEMDGKERYQQLAREYLQAVKDKKSALVVSPTHKEGEQVTNIIRDELRQAGKLDKQEKSFIQYRNLQWTNAQKSHAGNYQPGQVIQFHRNCQGLKRGEFFTVAGRSELGHVRVTNQAGLPVVLPLQQTDRFSVFEKDTVNLSQGDSVRITQNGYAKTSDYQMGVKSRRGSTEASLNKQPHRLNNGAIYQIKEFTANGDIRLNNGWVIGKNYGHVAYGYTATSIGSQGSTVDRVFIAQDSRSGRAASKEQFYVSVSRGRESVKIFCDDKAALRQSVIDSRARMSATEMVGKKSGAIGKEEGAYVRKMVRQCVAIKERMKTYASRTTDTAFSRPPEKLREREGKTR